MKQSDQEKYHNKGQSDASKGRYSPPDELPFGGLLGHSRSKDGQARHDAYRQGYREGRKQK